MTPEDEQRRWIRHMERGRRMQLWEEARRVDRICFVARVTFWALVLAVTAYLVFR